MDNTNSSGIYCIENIATGKKYIGQSINISYRWSKHIYELNHNQHDNDYLQKAWNKYGEKSFKFIVLEYCNINELDKKEVYYINKFNTLNRDLGYNLKSGGQNGGAKFSEETRNKLSESVKNSYTEDLRKRKSESAKEYWNNPENRKKIMGENNPNYGHHLSDDAKSRISQAKKGKKNWRRDLTPVLCIELNKIFEDATTASKELSIDSGGILKVCRNERKICGGYHWKFYINTENN